ncbi:SigE family RNA polymerase sigma factor [Nocardioides sp. JQ2195]|uniref:SigE family RNA polymerase sigma factor n=1 Tax=Nocardioides sp. JQ2195 TaxID=2592334 RepID=UPI001F116163|nr:SigE family RNA polymerase sigma factor [Nocardioides sp. JQ2195]
MDDAEFTQWAAGCQRQLLGTAYLISGDLQRAEDLVQEALTKVALRWHRLRHTNPDAYVRTILVHDNISWWRRHRRESVVGSVRESGVRPADTETSLVVRSSLARLTEKQRAVVVLRHFEDRSERETAEILGVSVGTVKSQNSAALARLREGAPELLDLIGRT